MHGDALSRNQSGHNNSSLNHFTYKSLFTITLLPSLYYYYYTHSFIHSPFHKHNLLHFPSLLHFPLFQSPHIQKCSSLFTPILERYLFFQPPHFLKKLFFLQVSSSFLVVLSLWLLGWLHLHYGNLHGSIVFNGDHSILDMVHVHLTVAEGSTCLGLIGQSPRPHRQL